MISAERWTCVSSPGRLTFVHHSANLGKHYDTELFSLLLLLAATPGTLLSQDNFFAKWESRTTATQARQPSWPPPLVSPYPMLIQVFRADFTRQITPTQTSTWNYGAGRGLNLIPGFNSEVDVYYAPYLQHNTPKVKDGFGDVGFLYKYRILSKNEMDGNYMLSAQLSATIPTGSYSNGSLDSSISPTVLAGKGFGNSMLFPVLGELCPRSKPTKWADPSRGIQPRSIISPSTCGPSWSQTPPGFLLGRIMANAKFPSPRDSLQQIQASSQR